MPQAIDDTLTAILREFFLRNGMERSYWIAFSGGLDSHVLLHLCHRMRFELPLRIRAIHVNHQLSPHSQAWAQQCRTVCNHYGIDYVDHEIQVAKTQGESLEELAREKRYGVFAALMAPHDMLLTAHQQDDQAETLLTQLFRGAGPKGLGAMPDMKPFAQGLHGRPLLQVSRHQLQAYADLHKLRWVEDESNKDCRLTRNFLRHDIIPVLATRWPNIAHTISRSAAYCAEAQALLEEFAQDLCIQARGSHEHTLSLAKIVSLPLPKQKLVLRSWIIKQGYPLPDARKLNTILQTVLTARWDRSPSVHWQNTVLRRYRDDLFLMPVALPHDVTTVHTWDFSVPLVIPAIGVLHAEKMKGKGLKTHLNAIHVTFRRGGESAHIPLRGRHTLKKLFHEWNILPWERDRIPLIYADTQLISAVGYFIDAHYAAREEEWGWVVTALPLV